MHNGSGYNHQLGLIELIRIGLIHSPSGRLLTSETFQGSLNVSGVSLKRKQIWTLYTEEKNPTAFLLQNHLGNFLSADHNGKVTLASEEPGSEERFIIHFGPRASGEIALQSEKHGFYLQWTGTEVRCFSKEPVWWGMRLGIHPQIHLHSVHRSCFVRSANKESELRTVTKMPFSPKFLLWLEQLPLPSTSGAGAGTSSKEAVARLSRVAIRTQSGRYLRGDSSLVDSIEEASLFAMSFKPGRSQVVMFQEVNGEYLTVGARGVLKVKMGAREPRREEFFSIETPSNQVRLWAWNNKYACNKHGLTFSTTMEELEDHKNTLYQLEYVGGRGLDMAGIVNAASTPSVDASSATFGFDGTDEGATYLTTGLWRLRSQDRRLWQILPTGSAELAPEDCTKDTTFEMLYVPSYMEEGTSSGGEGESKGRLNLRGGVVLRTLDGATVCAKPLGAIGISDKRIDCAAWQPSPAEVLHLLPLINRISIACYSPFACAFLAPAAGAPTRRSSLGATSTVDCTSCVPQQWFLRHLISGTVQFFTKQTDRWMILSVTSQGNVTLTPSETGPDEIEADAVAGPNSKTELVIFMTSDRYALLRPLLSVGTSRVASNSMSPAPLRLVASGRSELHLPPPPPLALLSHLLSSSQLHLFVHSSTTYAGAIYIFIALSRFMSASRHPCLLPPFHNHASDNICLLIKCIHICAYR
ncbi:fascin 2 [Echinococcus multilocularis]|uniref:Fascin 2 n=1 Tax=Echinococcus multilocularis TaxID=6211 RepID=A0A087W040_ECHMU|nr:fascin 2 [Echinococcus multilocularis]